MMPSATGENKLLRFVYSRPEAAINRIPCSRSLRISIKIFGFNVFEPFKSSVPSISLAINFMFFIDI